MEAFRELLACPACGGALSADWSCRGCGARYQAHGGIPNLRLASDARADVVRSFYECAPFPGYPPRDSLTWLRARAERSAFARLLDQAIPGDARILDIGCGDGFHLDVLREYGLPGWRLEGIDPSERAVEAAGKRGLKVRRGLVQEIDLSPDPYDLALMIATIEHVDDPPAVLTAVGRLLKPGGRVVVVTDNADSPDAGLFRGRHWGGYHFPRHWNLFTASTLRELALNSGFEVESLSYVASPVNWVYSIRNRMVDRGSPRWLIDQFSLRTPVSLAFFTLVDSVLCWMGKGCLLRAVLRKSP